MLFLSVIVNNAACEPAARLIFENQYAVDVTIFHEAVNKQGQVIFRREVGIVPAGQTVKTRGLALKSSYSGDVVVLKAEDSSGKVVWQQSWAFDDFLKLKKVGWKIVLSPQTGSPP